MRSDSFNLHGHIPHSYNLQEFIPDNYNLGEGDPKTVTTCKNKFATVEGRCSHKLSIAGTCYYLRECVTDSYDLRGQ